MNNFENIIANNLIYLRKKAGLTQLEFGEKFNYSDKTVSKWEQGTVIPSVETLKQIADFYGVSLDYIVSEHFNKKEYESTIKKTVNSTNKIILTILSAIVVVCITATIYVASVVNMGTADPNANRWWCAFLWMLPVCCLVTGFFTYRYFHNIKAVIVLLSIGVWTLLLAAFITFINKNIYWYLFIIGIPIQAGLILLTQLNKTK